MTLSYRFTLHKHICNKIRENEEEEEELVVVVEAAEEKCMVPRTVQRVLSHKTLAMYEYVMIL